MNVWAAFVLGLILGWLIEWVIDWFYWRKKQEGLQSELAALKAKQANVDALQQQVADLKAENASLRQQAQDCQGQLAAAQTPAAVQTKTTEVAAEAVPVVRKPDDLEIIKGIGPVIAKKLNGAGIFTFEELAAIDAARLREIVGDVIQRLADEESLLKQAAELAAKKKA
jgi:predicted flap endonuclease-1-like 5' DNA nuclease